MRDRRRTSPLQRRVRAASCGLLRSSKDRVKGRANRPAPAAMPAFGLSPKAIASHFGDGDHAPGLDVRLAPVAAGPALHTRRDRRTLGPIAGLLRILRRRTAHAVDPPLPDRACPPSQRCRAPGAPRGREASAVRPCISAEGLGHGQVPSWPYGRKASGIVAMTIRFALLVVRHTQPADPIAAPGCVASQGCGCP